MFIGINNGMIRKYDTIKNSLSGVFLSPIFPISYYLTLPSSFYKLAAVVKVNSLERATLPEES